MKRIVMKMRKMKHCLFLPFVALLLASCTEGAKYTEYNGTICYTYWTFSFGRQYKELPQVDPATFESVNNWLGRDAEHVYFKDRLVEGADASTVEAEKYPLFMDKSDYFYMTARMHVVDKESFKVLKRVEDHVWAKDSRYAFFDSLRIDSVELATFRVLEAFTAVDKNHVYYFGKILPLADPETYEPRWKGIYSRDKSHIWCGDDLLEDADYATFDVDEEGRGFDKYGRFYYEKRDTVP